MWSFWAKNLKKLGQFKYNRNILLALVLIVTIAFSMLKMLWAATPDPGHPWSEVGDGNFSVTGQTTARTYIFPDQSATVLTTNALVSVAQGGTGTSSLTGVIIGNGTSPMTAIDAPLGGNFFVTTSSSNSVTNKTINVSDNTLTANSMATGDLIQGSGYSSFDRLARGSANQFLRVNGSGNGLEWGSISSVAGSDKQLQYNDGGSFGATSSLAWDQTNKSLEIAGQLVLSTSSLPAVAATGKLKLFAQRLSGRSMLNIRADETDDYGVIQPSIYQNGISLVTACNTSSFCTMGMAMASFVSISAGSDSNYTTEGIFGNRLATGTTIESTKGYCDNNAQYYRGSLSSGRNGYFVFMRLGSDPDGVSGLQYYAGLTDQSGTNSVSATDPPGSRSGFAFLPTDSNWMFENKAGATVNRTDTGVAMATGKVYDLYFYNPPTGSTVSWRVDNLTDGTSGEGSASTSLPTSSVAMNICFGMRNTAGGTNIDMIFQKLYTEVPR